MARHIKHINSNSGIISEKSVRREFEDYRLPDSEDSALFGMISEYMKGRLDQEDVRKDPALPGMESIVSDMISDYHKKRTRNKDDEEFIRDVFRAKESDKKILGEISHIKDEISKSNIGEISAEWVKEWNEKIQKKGGRDLGKEEIRNFITSSLKSEKNKPEINLDHNIRTVIKRSLLIRYISLSVAAAIGIIVLIGTLLPFSDPEKLYNSYYEPFNIISPVTRNIGTSENDNYLSAIERYKIGDYQAAAIGFSNVIQKDISAIEPHFFMGITHLAMGNYDKAIDLLSDVTNRSGVFGKEAEWYLGLTYLKTGEKEKASVCFELLAQTPGFYRERADKILRRLK